MVLVECCYYPELEKFKNLDANMSRYRSIIMLRNPHDEVIRNTFFMNDCSCFYMMLNDNTSEEYL